MRSFRQFCSAQRLIMRSGLIFSLWASLSAHAQDTAPEPAVEVTLLDPSSITITGHLDTPGHTLTRELALRHIAEQIEKKRAEDAARSPLEPFWNASFWNSPLWIFIPLPLGQPRPTDDDPFFTPAYLTVYSRQDDHQLKRSEKAAQAIFEH
jgi:hypothetical protein